MSDIEHQVFGIVAKAVKLPMSEIALDKELVGDLGADSMALIDLATACQEGFRVILSDAQLAQIVTVRDICDTMRVLTGSASTGKV